MSSTPADSPTRSLRAGISPTASGAWFITVTGNVCCAASPSGSVAVTVTVAVPLVTPVTFTSFPVTETDAMPAFDDAAV